MRTKVRGMQAIATDTLDSSFRNRVIRRNPDCCHFQNSDNENFLFGIGSLASYPIYQAELETFGDLFEYPYLSRQVYRSVTHFQERKLKFPMAAFWDLFEVLVRIKARDLAMRPINVAEVSDQFCNLLYEVEEDVQIWSNGLFEANVEYLLSDSTVNRLCWTTFLEMLKILKLHIWSGCGSSAMISNRERNLSDFDSHPEVPKSTCQIGT